jgi:enoyl-CoA hydratase/carnithine racemase
MLADLERFLDEIDTEHASALIMYSSIKGGFSAGADLRELYRGLLDAPEKEHEPGLRRFIDRIHAVMDRLDTLPMTTIGVVHGVCFGGGFELALTCDILIAERTARFAFPELRLGLVPGFGGIPRLRRDVSNAVVRDILLTGRGINAKKAVACGLVSQMVPTGEGLRAARSAARQATKFDPDAAATCKRFMKPLPREQLAEEKEHFIRLANRPFLKAALKRFVESDDVLPYLP